MIVDHAWRRGTDRGTTCGTVDSTQWSRTVTANSGEWPRQVSTGLTTAPNADSARRFLLLAARWTTRRSASSGCAGVMWRCGLPLGAHLKFSWLVLPVYGVVCSGLGEGVRDLVGGRCRAWWPAPAGDGSEAVHCLRYRSDGGEEVDQSAVGVAQDYRAVAPRHVGGLEHDLGDGLGDEALDVLPGGVDVVDAQFDEDGAVQAGHRGGVAEHPDGRRGADGDGPRQRPEFGEDR